MDAVDSRLNIAVDLIQLWVERFFYFIDFGSQRFQHGSWIDWFIGLDNALLDVLQLHSDIADLLQRFLVVFGNGLVDLAL